MEKVGATLAPFPPPRFESFLTIGTSCVVSQISHHPARASRAPHLHCCPCSHSIKMAPVLRNVSMQVEKIHTQKRAGSKGANIIMLDLVPCPPRGGQFLEGAGLGRPVSAMEMGAVSIMACRQLSKGHALFQGEKAESSGSVRVAQSGRIKAVSFNMRPVRRGEKGEPPGLHLGRFHPTWASLRTLSSGRLGQAFLP